MTDFVKLRAEYDKRTPEEREERTRKYLAIPYRDKIRTGAYKWMYDWKLKEWYKAYNYSYMPRLFKDNSNTTTNRGPHPIWYTGGKNIRIPSKKHKNKWKKFIKLFPYYKYNDV